MSHAVPPAGAIVGTNTLPQAAVSVAVVMLIAVAAVSFWPSLAALADLWSDPERRTYQHGYAVAAITLWLLFRNRERARAAASAPAAAFLVLAVLTSIAWAVVLRAGLQTAHVLLWPLVLWLALAGLLGWRAGRMLAFPIAYLYFAMPLWDALVPLLQEATVAANHILTAIFAIPAYIEGDSVHIPAGTFVIEGRCSGLNYFVAALAISALLGEVNREAWRRRLVLIALAGTLAVLSNWLRVFVVIVAGHLTGMQHYLVRVDHVNFGWVVFAAVMTGYFVVVRKLPPAATVEPAPTSTAVKGRAGMSPGLLLLAGAAMAAGPVLDLRASHRPVPTAFPVIAPAIPDWEGPQAASGDWHPLFPGADGELLADYSRGGAKVSVYAAVYLWQEQSRELVSYRTSLVGTSAGSWRGPGRHVDPGGTPWAERQMVMRDGDSLMWWSYRVDRRGFSRGLAAQVWYGLASLWSSPVSSVIALRTDCHTDCRQASENLRLFAAQALPYLAAASNQGAEH